MVHLKLYNSEGYFYIEKDGDLIAKLEFKIKNNILFATHTEVNKEYNGKGLASKLFDEMIQFVEENEYQVVPICSYIEIKFKRDIDKYQSILFKNSSNYEE